MLFAEHIPDNVTNHIRNIQTIKQKTNVTLSVLEEKKF